MPALAAARGRLAQAAEAAVDLAGGVEVSVGEIGDLVQAVEAGILQRLELVNPGRKRAGTYVGVGAVDLGLAGFDGVVAVGDAVVVFRSARHVCD